MLTNYPLLSSNFFGTQIFISPPTPKTVPRKFLVPQSILNNKNFRKPKNVANHAALVALLFSSVTPQALALDNTPPPASAPQVIEVEAQKPGPSSPFAQNLILNAPNPQAQPAFDLPDGSQWRYSEFLNAMKKGKVEMVRFSKDGGVLQLTAVDGRRANAIVPNDPDLIDILAMNGVDISVSEGRTRWPWRALGGPMHFGRSKSKFHEVPESGVTFADVAGADQAKLELQEVVDFLKNPDKYTALGAKILKGCVLVGPSVAGEAGVPFFSWAASEFVELFVVVGASRVRGLFEKSKSKAPCIMFIDEIDVVGRHRGTGVIVLTATNRLDVLDSALLRPGRFDRRVTIDRPDVAERVKILQVHSRGKALAKDVDFEKIAKRTLGFTGADLQNLMNEAAILAARRDLKEISKDGISDALERIIVGPEKKNAVVSDEKERLIAYHEAGHALVGALMAENDPVAKISIIPRGQAGGFTFFAPSEERLESGLYNRSYLEN
ncbi:ATP-dependent zinc metalloprotease FTSH, chloroplastic [Sesamum alatum]|uniref:ATP-dependent zinc metalloprotease FTSH, chloroplastic n=1 Tax=Sesamum alatum TaxID=300844 RepID=A0AAE1YQD1_9LAMI|nr:ATP-dependent zinc metalloprotease FTSH, chloroplastic [Sesamum alatum]